jgi:hypothetical protein
VIPLFAAKGMTTSHIAAITRTNPMRALLGRTGDAGSGQIGQPG